MEARQVELNPGGQSNFFLDSHRIRGLFGGRGSGKSCAGALAVLREIQEQPGLPGAIIAPDYPSLVRSTIPEFMEWVPDGVIIEQSKSEGWWLFRNGSKVYYSGIDDPDSWRGPNLAWCWFDESGRKKTIDAWLVILGCMRVGKAKLWTTSTPRGLTHWLADTFVKNPKPGIHSHHFASSRDNAHNLEEHYIETLEASYVGPWREQELEGKFVAGFGTLARREWFGIVSEAPDTTRRARFWDLAATEKKTAKQDPDWTAGARVSEHGGVYYIEDMARGQLDADAVDNLLKDRAKSDGRISIGIEQEPGASGKILIEHYKKMLSDRWVQGFRPTGDKVARAMPWIAKAKAGRVKLVQGLWNEDFLQEVENFPIGSHDDMCDAVSGACEILEKSGGPYAVLI